MKKQLWKCLINVVALGLITVSLTSCASSPKSRFYVFPNTAKTGTQDFQDFEKAKFNVGILPATLPPYLDRPQIVTRLSPSEIFIDEFSRWGSPLQVSVMSTVAGTIANELPMSYIDVFPWSGDSEFQYQVTIEVMRLDGILGESAYLAAQWTITRGKKLENLVARKTSIFHEKLDSTDYSDYAEGLRSLSGQLGSEIAEAIKADFDALPDK